MRIAKNADQIARELARIAIDGGNVIRKTIAFGITSTLKADGSECSNADIAAQDYVLGQLQSLFSGIPIIAEEQTHTSQTQDRTDTFFLVDPLDGTRSFLAGGHEYGVNIALIDNQKPIAGAIHAPALKRTWFGGENAYLIANSDSEDDIARSQRIKVRSLPKEGMTALASHRKGDPQSTQFLSLFPIVRTRHIASSIKFGVIAEGQGDIYVRYGPTMEWDTAAGHAILNAAGGCVTDLSGIEKTYGFASKGYLNEAFVAWANPDMARSFLGGSPKG
jgi:3'(2'), 5'-bisphosphate nucleotidase